MINRFTFLIFFVATSPYLMAQDIASASLRWTCNQTTNLRDGSTSSYSCAFITRGTDRITWLQRNNEAATDYTITGTEGAWSDVKSNGTFAYLISRDGKAGRMTVRRTAEGITITLDFSSQGEMAIKRQFSVSEIQPAN
jgi:hypothetical protein